MWRMLYQKEHTLWRPVPWRLQNLQLPWWKRDRSGRGVCPPPASGSPHGQRRSACDKRRHCLPAFSASILIHRDIHLRCQEADYRIPEYVRKPESFRGKAHTHTANVRQQRLPGKYSVRNLRHHASRRSCQSVADPVSGSCNPLKKQHPLYGRRHVYIHRHIRW